MGSPLCVLVLKLKSLHEEKKEKADAFNSEIKELEKEIFEIALQERTGQSSMFFGDGQTEINPRDSIS